MDLLLNVHNATTFRFIVGEPIPSVGRVFGQTTEICLRGLSFLVAEKDGGLVQSSDIARKLGISPTYLSKAFQPLALNGILRSVRGRNGGWILAVDPKTTALARVIEILEPAGRWKKCVIGNTSCADETACPFHFTWKQTVEEFTRILDSTMLSSLVDFLPPHVAIAPESKDEE